MVKLAMHFAQGLGSACSVAIHRSGKKKAAGWHAGGRLERSTSLGLSAVEQGPRHLGEIRTGNPQQVGIAR